MRRALIINAASAALVLAACVTINVYFPEAAAERAADRVIDNVWGQQAAPAAPTTEGGGAPPSLLVRATLGLLDTVLPAAHAQANFDISSPAINALIESMRRRFGSLEAYYDSGAIGLATDATIEIRDRNLIPLAERNRVRELVADENSDRNRLYREIAQANGHPEWESQVRETFGERWIARAHKGWYYRTGNGEWAQK